MKMIKISCTKLWKFVQREMCAKQVGSQMSPTNCGAHLRTNLFA